MQALVAMVVLAMSVVVSHRSCRPEDPVSIIVPVPVAIIPVVAMSTAPAATPPPANVYLKAAPLSLSKEGYNLILKHEVGGGAAYYSRYLSRPTWPGGASGVTIGVGYDLGYNTRTQIATDWWELPTATLIRLQSVAGLRGAEAKRLAPTLASIAIPWDSAERVYRERTIPRFAALTEQSYKGTATLHPHAQGSMLSWVFNRGEGISATSSRDIEKRAMRDAIPKHAERVPPQFRASKRLWIGVGLDGLLNRREDEARLMESVYPPQK